MYDQLWFTSQDSPGPDSGLDPFSFDVQGDRWTSNKARHINQLGYGYDDLSPPSPDSGTDEKENFLRGLRKSINDRYSSTRNKVLGAPKVEGTENDYIINVVYDR